MKAILIDDLLKDAGEVQFSTKVTVDGLEYEGYQVAKPLNHEKEYISQADREAMAKLVLEGKAIAVQYFSDLTEEEQVAYVRERLNE